MKIFKRILIAIVAFLVLGVAFLLAAPILFKDKIMANVKYSANRALNAEVDFRDVNLSFLRSFPDVALSIDDLEVMGIDTFAGLPLLTAKNVGVDVGFWSVVGGDGNYYIDEVRMDSPTINLLVLTPELANYLIVPESDSPALADTSAAPATAQINLEHYEIQNGTLVYDDRTTETYLKIEGLDTRGDGDFTASIFDLDTYSEAGALTLRQGGMTYLSKVKAVADAIVNVDLDNSRYTFQENAVRLNALDLVFGGSIDLEDNDDIVFDLTYSAPANDFRQLWSLIPAAYTQGFEEVQTTGTFTLNGTVNGAYNGETETYPAFTVQTDISGGSVQYPGRPVGLTGIDAQVAVNSPSSDLDQLKVDISRFNFNLGGDDFAGSFKLATPMSDPNVDARLKGKIDLDKWAKAIPLDGVRELGGVILADITMNNVRQSLLTAGRYAEVALSGNASVSQLVYVADDLPAVRIATAAADFTPQSVNISDFQATLGRSDVQANGRITTPLAYFSPTQTMRGDMTVRSRFFDADEWMEEESAAAASPAELGVAAASSAPESDVFDRFDFNIDAEIDELQYTSYRPKNLKAVGNIKPNQLSIATASGTLGSSSFSGTGTITNLFDYTFGNGVLGGDLSVRSPFIDLADFMEEESSTATAEPTTATGEEASAAIPVPTNINLKMDVVADRVKYDNITLNAMQGKMLVQGGQAVIEDGSAALLGGRMAFAGAYDTSEPGDPGFRFHYDLSSLDFQESFAVLNSFAALAPIGKFLQGNFSTDLVLEGKLGPDLFPKLSTLDAKGFFQTAEARLTAFPPLQKIGQALDVESLKQSAVFRNLVTVFQINDGKVSIEPFDLKLAGIPMTIAGTHGLEQDMNYTINAAIPRSLIKGNIVTGTALSALDKLAGEAGKLGLNITPGDTLNIAIGLTGSIGLPQTSFKLLGTNGSGPQTVQDAVKDRLQNELDTRRDQVENEINNQVDAVRKDAERRLDSLKNIATDRSREIQDSIRNAVNVQTNRLRQEAEQRLRMQLDSARIDSLRRLLPPGVNENANRVKEELEKFNPFKKKKPDGGK